MNLTLQEISLENGTTGKTTFKNFAPFPPVSTKTIQPFQKKISHFTRGIATYSLLPVCFDLRAGATFVYKMGMVQQEEHFRMKKHLKHKSVLEQ